jgi:ATP-dependent helicase/nuclease subunit A
MSEQLRLFDPAAEHPVTPAPAVTAVAVDGDDEARRFAQDPAENVVLEASAGTGKTTVLVARYVNLLARGVDPSNILAITFTRKAAAEMRDRIVRELRRAADQSAFDRGRWAALRDRLADIQISTIDAFCLSLLREFPLEADLDPGFTLADETEVPRLIDQSLDRSLGIFVARARHDPDIALVLAQLGMSRTREGLAHLLGRRLVAWDVLDRFLARGPASLTSSAVCAQAIADVEDLCRSLDGGLQQFLDDGPTGQPRFRQLAHDLSNLHAFRNAEDASVRGLVDRVAAHFLSSDGRARSSAARIWPYVAADYPSPEAGRRHRVEVVRVSGQVERLVRAFARGLNAVLARGVRQMFAIALAEYRKALNDRSVLDFSDVLERAVDLLRRMDEFSQSRFRLEGRFHHVLVDEFQDTSRKQWELVSLLVHAWGEGQGLAASPSIFIVGDRKQSIYRFRDADVAVMEEAAKFIADLRPGGRPRRAIARSFRAVPELLAFINELFGHVGRDACRPDDFTYDDRDRFPLPEGHRFDPALGIAAHADADASAEAVASEIARVLREETVREKQTGVARAARPGDIAILFRSRTSHREFEAALAARGIPAYVYKGLGFFDADEIKDVSALIRFLADPRSELRAAAFLRSRFVGLSDPGLTALAPRLVDAILGEPSDGVAALETEDRAALDRARASVPAWIAAVDRVPPADLLEQILPASAYAYELRGSRRDQAWENLKKMRGLIRRIQNRGYATLGRIADHLDSLSAGDESNAVLEALDAVNLMTVHAAKGLEFPIVFVVNIGKGASGPPKPVRATGDDVSVGPFVSDTDEAERAREREEIKRLLYVALTRARDRLYLATVLKDGQFTAGPGSLGSVLPDTLKPVFVSAAAAASDGDRVSWTADSGREFQFRCCRSNPSDDAQAEARDDRPDEPTIDDFSWVADSASVERVAVCDAIASGTEQQRRGASDGEATDADVLGSIVHGLFADPPADQDAALNAARALADRIQARPTGESSDVAERAVAAWRQMSTRPDLVRILDDGDRLHEIPFTMRDPDVPGRLLRGTIDCMVRRPDGRIAVLEFKTGRPREQDRRQLETYVRAARELFPDVTVEGLLVYP